VLHFGDENEDPKFTEGMILEKSTCYIIAVLNIKNYFPCIML